MWQILGFCLLVAFPAVASVGCKDQNNNDVDWFVGYKMPEGKDDSLPGIGDGVAYYYMDVNTDSLAPSIHDLNSKQQVREGDSGFWDEAICFRQLLTPFNNYMITKRIRTPHM